MIEQRSSKENTTLILQGIENLVGSYLKAGCEAIWTVGIVSGELMPTKKRRHVGSNDDVEKLDYPIRVLQSHPKHMWILPQAL